MEYCNSDETGSDSCNFTTNSTTFYTQVLAYSSLLNGTLSISGNNVVNASEVNGGELELYLDQVKGKGERTYKVLCDGPCGSVTLNVSAQNGDPDLTAG